MSVWVSGRVQGVGFRYWTRKMARELGLRGSATNLPDGRVAIVAEGPGAACQSLLAALRGEGPPGAVTEVVPRWAGAAGEADGFRIG